MTSFLYFWATNQFLFILIALPVILLGVGLIRKKSTNKYIPALFGAFCIWGVILFFIFGQKLAYSLLFKNGITGAGVVTEINSTGDLYNDEPILRYNVVLKSSSGTVESYFESDDFILYPEPSTEWEYPKIGQRFTIKYLDNNLSDFIILTNDTSQYAKDSRCKILLSRLKAAEKKLEFDKENKEYKKALDEAIKRSGECNQ